MTSSHNSHDIMDRATESQLDSPKPSANGDRLKPPNGMVELNVSDLKNGEASPSTVEAGGVKKRKKRRLKAPIKLTRTQWFVILSFSVGNLAAAMSFSLQAPFYPKTAESKNVTPSEYGMVFASYYLSNFCVAPLWSKILPILTPRVLLNLGFLVHNIAVTAFGFVDLFENGSYFLGVSLALRMLEGIGISAYITAATTILMHEFHDNIGAAFSYMKTAFSVGLIIGPTFGGVLYDRGGFYLPFVVCGTICFIAMIVTILTVPKIEKKTDEKRPSVKVLLKEPQVYLYMWTVFAAYLSVCFQQATLEPHLRPLGYSATMVGMFFMLQAGTNIISVPIWGILCDKKVLSATLLTALATSFLCVFDIFIGPFDFLPFSMSLWTVIVGCVAIGIAIGGSSVCAFIATIRFTQSRGFKNDISTNAMISSTFTFCQCAGSFIGPGVGGILSEFLGYSQSTIIFFFITAPVVILLFIVAIREKSVKEGDSTKPEIEVKTISGIDDVIRNISRQNSALNDDDDDGAKKDVVASDDAEEEHVVRHRTVSQMHTFENLQNAAVFEISEKPASS